MPKPQNADLPLEKETELLKSPFKWQCTCSPLNMFFMECIFPPCCCYKAVVVYLDATIFPNKAKLYVLRLWLKVMFLLVIVPQGSNR